MAVRKIRDAAVTDQTQRAAAEAVSGCELSRVSPVNVGSGV